jgi:hypothetical protein
VHLIAVPPPGKKEWSDSKEELRVRAAKGDTERGNSAKPTGVVMARQVITTLIDDLDGKKADRTVEFSLDGTAYTIDLSDANAGKLRKALDPFIAAGTRVGRGSGRTQQRHAVASGRPPGSRDENKAIREWAAANGHQISERGRIPQSVSDAYRAAHRR